MKILTVCLGGLVRSVAFAEVLKLRYGIRDVLSLGYDFNPPETQKMLFEWADRIIVVERFVQEKIPVEYHSKIVVCEVGPDTYGNAKNPELLQKASLLIYQNKGVLGLI